jgi:hypothetical protein
MSLTCLVDEAVDDPVEWPALEVVGLACTLLALRNDASLACRSTAAGEYNN